MIEDKPILLVEDNPMDADLTLRAFRRRKMLNPVQVLRDGEEALAMLARWDDGQEQPCVILLDLKLPKIGGLEVLQRLKDHPVYQSIPVVVLTTSDDDSDVKNAYKNGANSYIVKPVSFEKFVEVAAHIDLYWRVLNKPPV